MLCWLDIIFPLGAATLTGSVIGMILDFQKKPTGMRTLAPVALASAAAVLAAKHLTLDADGSRAIQGVLTGVGFLGAGVILRRAGQEKGGGVPTAATIWLTASLGLLCGLAAWSIWIIAVVLTAFVLSVGDTFEKWLQRRRLSNLLHDLVPQAAVIGFLMNPKYPNSTIEMKGVETAARSIGKEIVASKASSESELNAGFATMAKRGVGAILVGSDTFFNERRDQIVSLEAQYRIPAYYVREFARQADWLTATV